MALHDLEQQQKAPTFVRSFAYGTGPAYGLLLDEYAPNWRSQLTTQVSLNDLLQQALQWHPNPRIEEQANQRAIVYGGPALEKAEQERDALHQATVRQYRALLVDGSTLTAGFTHMKVQFNPQNLLPLGDAGTVYPTMRITDDWGILEATQGALMKPDWSAVLVTAPMTTTGNLLTGRGWTLHLTTGWKVVPGEKKGDLVLQSPIKPPSN